ncbi:4Fe-4S dicluster domain-containing protein [bacterium]|nr:4Fe-4S dicluster domain-containing protein [bacterium]
MPDGRARRAGAQAGREDAAPDRAASAGRRPLIARRDLAWGVGGALALGALGAIGLARPAAAQVRPPGGQDGRRVLSACVHCGLCVEACPQHVIAPARVEDGLTGMRTPVMDFSEGHCAFCAEDEDADERFPLCARACPSGALRVTDFARPREVRVGLARITERDCLAFRGITCHYCLDACPFDAIEMDEGDRPHVREERCNGCGACEEVCVSLKNGASRAGQARRAVYVAPLDDAAQADADGDGTVR